MRIQWTEIGAAGLFVGAACALAYAGLQRSLRRAVAEQQESTDRQLAAMAATLKALQSRVTELNRLTAERADEVDTIQRTEDNGQATDSMKPEMLAVITAAATTFLGKAARIRSAKLVPAHESTSAWTQQGRMIVQTSHNLRTRD